MNHKQNNEPQVIFDEQKLHVLSNFSSCGVEWNGIHFDTCEHAYNWEKFRGQPNAVNAKGSIAEQVRRAKSARAALELAEEFEAHQRPDWYRVKGGIMRDLVRATVAQNYGVKQKLIETGTRQLIEDSWQDEVWCWGESREEKNMLSQIWMEIRDELKCGYDDLKQGP